MTSTHLELEWCGIKYHQQYILKRKNGKRLYLYVNRMDLVEDREESQEVNKIKSTNHHC